MLAVVLRLSDTTKYKIWPNNIIIAGCGRASKCVTKTRLRSTYVLPKRKAQTYVASVVEVKSKNKIKGPLFWQGNVQNYKNDINRSECFMVVFSLVMLLFAF